MIKLQKIPTAWNKTEDYLISIDEGPNIEVTIPGREITQEALAEAFQTFATAVLGYAVEVSIEMVQ